jgi:hypothetical protein
MHEAACPRHYLQAVKNHPNIIRSKVFRPFIPMATMMDMKHTGRMPVPLF